MAKERHHISRGIDNTSNRSGSSSTADPPPMPEPVGTATTMPWLSAKSSRRRAATAALYYGEAYMQGIDMEEADLAALNIKNCYNKWWMQHHFKNCKVLGDDPVSDDYDDSSAGEGQVTVKPAAAASITAQRHKYDDGENTETLPICCTSPTITGKKQSKRKRTDDDSVPLVSRSNSSVGMRKRHSHVRVEEGEDAMMGRLPILIIPPPENLKTKIKKAKTALLDALSKANGETNGKPFLSALGNLEELFKSTSLDLRGKKHSRKLDGAWLTMSNPKFQESLGQNTNGDYMYTLGRMSFDMFRPDHLRCSMQAMFNPISIAEVAPSAIPKSLRKEVEVGSTCLRNYK